MFGRTSTISVALAPTTFSGFIFGLSMILADFLDFCFNRKKLESSGHREVFIACNACNRDFTVSYFCTLDKKVFFFLHGSYTNIHLYIASV